MSISQSTLDRIRELVSLADYFSDCGVKKEGPRHVCACPFHTNSGKSTTLTLWPDGKAKCWSCGWRGDIFDACMAKEGVDWAEAVERLAKRAGIQVERTGRDATDKASAERSRRSLAIAAAEWATGWFQSQLVVNPSAKGYLLVDRKLPQDVIDRWRLGWAPGDQIIPAGKAGGHTIEALRDAGLVVEKEDGRLRSFFYERVVIPITNSNGKVISWTARAMPDVLKEAATQGRSIPKYINCEDTLIYQKRKALLGLRDALPHAKKHQAVIIVEGALDVLALDCLGVPVGCCACGTALGEDQADALIDLGSHHEVPLVLLYDGDGAGSNANRKTAELLFKLGGRAKVAMLPEQVEDPHGGTVKVKDCADVWYALGQAGAAIITAALEKAIPAWDYLVDRACPGAGAVDIDSRLIAADKLLAIVNQIEDDERRELALSAAGDKLGLTRAQLVRRSDRQRDETQRKRPAGSDPVSAGNTAEGAWGYTIPIPQPESQLPPGKDQDFELNELGNAFRFAAHFGTRVRYVATWGQWIIWNGVHWTIDNGNQAQRWMFDAVDTSCRAEASRAWDKARLAPKNSRDAADWTQRAIELERWRSKALNSRSKGNSLDVATCLRCMVVTSDQLDSDIYLFACKNGWVDLRTGILSPHDATKLYTRAANIEYDPAARDGRWERYLDEATGSDRDMIGFLQRFSGYSATGDISEQALLMLTGPGGTGKSLFTRCLKSILGGYAYTAGFEIFLASHGDKVKWTLANLEKTRLVICEESGEGRRFSADIVKQVTGGTPIEAQSKGKQPFTYEPLFKVFLVTNHPPRVSDRDDGFWRRLKLVRFDKVPAKRDKNLAAHLTGTATAQQAILSWVIQGAMEWHKNGLQPPASIEDANAQYRDDQNPIRDYLAERTIWVDTLNAIAHQEGRAPVEWASEAVAKSILRLDYMNWCKDGGLEPISARQFAERLRELGAVDDGYTYNPDRDRSDRAWSGLRLRDRSTDNSLPGGPLAYQIPAAEAAAETAAPQQCLDSDPAAAASASSHTDAKSDQEPRHICGQTPSAAQSAASQTDATQDDTTAGRTTAICPPHLHVCARDASHAPENDLPGENVPSIRARMDPICGPALEEEKGLEGPDIQPPLSDRARKLRQQPSPDEDLFANPPPDQPPPREPGADEDEVWPPPDQP
jgi:DNA primase catalytic core